MAHKAMLPKISDCVSPAPRPVSLSDQRIVQAIGAFLVLAALCVGHIYLRFAIRDLKVQHQALQEKTQKLQMQSQGLEREIAQLRDSQRLREYAKYQMGMQESDPRTQVVTMVSEQLKDKYRVDAGAAARLGSSHHATGDDGKMLKLLMTLVDANKAFAGTQQK